MNELALHLVLVVCGLAGHFFGKLVELRKAEQTLTARKYFKANPYQVMFSLVSAMAGAIALHEYGELTAASAIGIGYMSDSILDKLGNRSAQALK